MECFRTTRTSSSSVPGSSDRRSLELSKKGFQTLSMEKLHTAGYGSTAGSCGVIRAHYSTEAGVRFAYEGFFYWLDWENHIGTEDDLGLAQYINCGTVLLKTRGHNYEKVLRHYRKVGVEYEEWTNVLTITRMCAFLDTRR